MELIAAHESALAETVRLARGVRPDQLEAATPCTEWDVRDLLAHVARGNREFAKAARHQEMSFDGEAPALGDDPAEAYAETAAELSRTWREVLPDDGDYTVMGKPSSAEAVMGWQLAEITLHGWDLAKATGQRPDFPAEAVDAAASFVEESMPTERPPGFPFGPATAPPPDSGPLDRLAALSGRTV